MRCIRKLCLLWLSCLLITNGSMAVFAAETSVVVEHGELIGMKEINGKEDGKEKNELEPEGQTTTENQANDDSKQLEEEKKSENQTKDATEHLDEGNHTVSLKIDNQNVYEGMTRAYKKGYQPIVEKNQATIVLPLLCEGKVKQNCLTASVELGNTENSPFMYRTYEKTFTLKPEPINGTKETKEVFLVSFVLELQKKHQNGIYPVTIQIKGADEYNNALQQSFTCYVVITDGVDPNGMPDNMGSDTLGSAEETPTSAPIVLVSQSKLGSDTVKAGEDFEAVITLKNTSKKKSVQNMVVTVQSPSADMELKNDSNTIFVGKLGTEKTIDLTLRFHVNKSIAEGNYPIEIAMSYDDAKATTLNSTGMFMVTVEQPLSVELTMPVMQKEMTVGDTIPLTFQVMNLGRSKVYNVRCDVECNGLTQTKTAFIGNMESGTEGEGNLNLFVSPMEGETAYGKVTGTVHLTYEDSFGHEQSQNISFDTSILKKTEVTQTYQNEESESASQWWISIAILSGIIVVIGCSMVAYFLGRRKR